MLIIYKFITRSKLIATLSKMQEYTAFARTNISAIFSEQNFQRNGCVDPAKMKKTGALGGIDILFISKITGDDWSLNLEITFLDVLTIKVIKSGNILTRKDVKTFETNAITLT